MFPWSYSRQGQPNDLPDIFKEDIFMLMPVDSQQLYAGWNISYEHQNIAADIWGEERFAASRLAIKLIFLPNTENFCLYDVSGPGQSVYLQLPEYPKAAPAHIHLAGLLGYCSQDLSFLPIVASSVTFMSTGRIQVSQDEPAAPPKERIKLLRRDNPQPCGFEGGPMPHNYVNAVKPFHTQIDPEIYSDASNPANLSFSLGRLAEALDKQMGRSSLNGDN